MKLITFCILFSLLFTVTIFSQPKVQEEILAPEQFGDTFKSIWNEVKKITEKFQEQTAKKNEFETSTEFQKRVAREREMMIKNISTINTEKKLSTKTFVVLFKAELSQYNADKQEYTVKSSTKILIPPTSEQVQIECSKNPYLTISEMIQKAYKFSYLVLRSEPDFIWRTDNATAKLAKSNETNIFFKVWMKVDLTQPLIKNQAQVVIKPTKIVLLNNANNTVYWTKDFVQ